MVFTFKKKIKINISTYILFLFFLIIFTKFSTISVKANTYKIEDLEISKPYDNNFNKECLKLVIHGLLHILGYDHALKKEELIMFNKTDDILSYILNKN